MWCWWRDSRSAPRAFLLSALVGLATSVSTAQDTQATSSPGIPPPQAETRELAVQRAYDHLREGYRLAERRAVHAARVEFVAALRLLARSRDGDRRAECSHALENGLRGLHDADRIARQESIEAVQSHLFRVQQALAYSVAHEPVGSLALSALARGQLATADGDDTPDPMACPKAAALYQAALAVDPSNVLAANELGVLLARYGRMEDAQNAFRHALAVSPQPELWENLAVVYAKLGQLALAERAKAEGQKLLSARRTATLGDPARPSSSVTPVAWVAPAEFMQRSPAWDKDAPPARPATAAQPSSTNPVAESAPKTGESPARFTLLPKWISDCFTR